METRTSPTLEQPPHSLADLFTRPNLQRIAANSVLFHEGEAPAGVYILHSGRVDLIHAQQDDGMDRRRAAHAGEILGLSAVISGRSHLTTAIAMTLSEVGFIEGNEFRKLVDDNPAIWFSVLRQLSQDVNDSYETIRKGQH